MQLQAASKRFDGKKDFHFRILRALSIDPDKNIVSTIAGDLHYDYLVIGIGMKTNFFGNEEIQKYSLPLKINSRCSQLSQPVNANHGMGYNDC